MPVYCLGLPVTIHVAPPVRRHVPIPHSIQLRSTLHIVAELTLRRVLALIRTCLKSAAQQLTTLVIAKLLMVHLRVHTWMSVVSFSRITTIGVSLVLTSIAPAGSQEQALSSLIRVEDTLRDGTVLTAIAHIQPGDSHVLERCTLYRDNIRVDSIMGFKPGEPLHNPTISVEISKPSGRVSASICLRGNFPDSDAVFSRLYSKPSPEVRKVEGVSNTVSSSLQVLGYTGSRWLSEKLRQAGDGTLRRDGNEQVVSWGEKSPVKTEVRIVNGQPFLNGYEYLPGPRNHAFKRFTVEKIITEKGTLATFSRETVGSEADQSCKLSILDFKHQIPPEDFFVLSEPEHSLINSAQNPESVYQIVDGKRVLNYNRPNPNTEDTPLLPILGISIGTPVFLFCIVMLLKKKREASRRS